MSSLVRDAIFWVAVACCAVGSLAILRLTLAPHTRGAVGASHELPRSSRSIEITWVVLPMVALAGLLLWTHREMRATAGTPHVAPAHAHSPASSESSPP